MVLGEIWISICRKRCIYKKLTLLYRKSDDHDKELSLIIFVLELLIQCFIIIMRFALLSSTDLYNRLKITG